jgi:hypothetical protein
MSTVRTSKKRGLYAAFLLALVSLLSEPATLAQSTTATGSIQGTITDPTGAVVSGAPVTITSEATAQEFHLLSSAAGTYNLGAVLPGTYLIKIAAQGFRPVSIPVIVQVGAVSAGNIKLQVGAERQALTVGSSAVSVNTEQATVQGVLTPQQIEQLPANGRNFLDLAQLEPGVQIQDGKDFHPTKAGFTGVSVGGRFGRTTRIEVDGVDISDETVGTTTQNIPQSAIQEFQISQSLLDLPTDLTSSGAVNVITETGTSQFHGEGFYNFRDDSTAAKVRTGVPFQRNQFGGRLGGPLIANKFFFFVDAEHTKQDLVAPVALSLPFDVLDNNFRAPFRETQAMGRLDWQIRPAWRAFYRFSYDQNRVVATFLPNTFQPFNNRNHTPVHALGLDFTTGGFNHSIRVGYTKFSNSIADATETSGAFDPLPGIELGIGGDPTCVQAPNQFCSGPTVLAPQATYQSNKQVKYDGSRSYRNHIVRYGFGVDRIVAGGFEALFKNGPGVLSEFTPQTEAFADNSCGPSTPCFPNGRANPLNYPVTQVVIGNGQGFFTEIPAFGLPGGGRADTRLSGYVGDTWKVKPNFTLNYGLRYVRDTGRSDSDIPPIPCSASPLVAALSLPCTGNLLDLFGGGLGNRVRQPNRNFGPQLAIAWDPHSTGKTVFRAGIGLFYENAIFNNVLFDRPARESTGLFFGAARPCPGNSIVLPDGTPQSVGFCGQAIGEVASQIIALQQTFEAATAALGAAGVNRTFVGNTLAEGFNVTGNELIAPNYRTPYSIQMNAGLQKEIGRGTVLSADYVRNVGLHFLLGVDTNHVGDARFLDSNAALAAVDTTIFQNQGAMQNCGNLLPVSAGASAQAAINCYLAHFNGLTQTPGGPIPDPFAGTIGDFAQYGLDSGATFGGFPAAVTGMAPAFPGQNSSLGENQMLFPIGRSVYNALLVSLRHDVESRLRGVKHLSLQVSYALSRFRSVAEDQDFIGNAIDFRNPLHYLGPNSLDRTHQISVGSIMDLPGSLRLSFTSHYDTALPGVLTLPVTGLPGEIFRTDTTGDGTTGDVLPGTNVGSLGRDVKVSTLNNVIRAYDSTQAGTVTPAGQALLQAGVFNQTQLVALGAVTPTIRTAPPGQVGIDALKTIDARLTFVLRLNKVWHSAPESLSLQPSISAFNLFNFANFDPPTQLLTGSLDGAVGSANGTTRALRTNRIGFGTGIFALGAPRILEWGLNFVF